MVAVAMVASFVCTELDVAKPMGLAGIAGGSRAYS